MNLYLYLRQVGGLFALVLMVVACQGESTSPATPTTLATPVSLAKPTLLATPAPELIPTSKSTPPAAPTPMPAATSSDLNNPADEPARGKMDDGTGTILQVTPEPSAQPQAAGEIPTAEFPPDISDPLLIESLRQHRDDPPPIIEIMAPLVETDRFTRYQIAYTSDDLRITGVMNVPRDEGSSSADTGPRSDPGVAQRFPVVLLNHGYYSPASYIPGTGTQLEADYLADHGYVTIASDYRGYAGSEGTFGGHFDPGWTYDILDLLDALPSLDFVDPKRVGMWGHSTGGEIALRIITARDSVDATVLFGSMGADAADNFRLVQGWGGGHTVARRYGTPEEAPEVWVKLSPMTYLADVSGPISIHHGALDGEVPPELSAKLWEAMQAAGIPGEYYTYPDQRHVFRGEAWELAMERTLAFFDKYVKNQ